MEKITNVTDQQPYLISSPENPLAVKLPAENSTPSKLSLIQRREMYQQLVPLQKEIDDARGRLHQAESMLPSDQMKSTCIQAANQPYQDKLTIRAKLLQELGVNFQASRELWISSLDAFEKLLQVGGDPNIRNDKGELLLHRALFHKMKK